MEIDPFDPGKVSEGRLSSGLSSYGYDAKCGYRFKLYSPIGAVEIDPKAFDPKSLVDVDLTPHHMWAWGTRKEGDNHYATIRCKECGKERPADGGGQEVCPESKKEKYLRIPPHSFALAETIEHFEIPRSCLAIVLGKSTYARCGISVPLTPLEPEWRGKVTVEIANTTPLPARIYPGEGIMQIVFFRTDGYRKKVHEVVRGLLDSTDFGHVRGNLDKFFHEGTCRTSYADKKGRYLDQTGITLPTTHHPDKDAKK